jgi:hypothetical protein
MFILCIVILLTAFGIASGAIASPKFRQEILNFRDEVAAAFGGQDVFPDVEYVREAANTYYQRTSASA